jgi:hypothetical protein
LFSIKKLAPGEKSCKECNVAYQEFIGTRQSLFLIAENNNFSGNS